MLPLKVTFSPNQIGLLYETAEVLLLQGAMRSIVLMCREYNIKNQPKQTLLSLSRTRNY
jgi:hypothetical protein